MTLIDGASGGVIGDLGILENWNSGTLGHLQRTPTSRYSVLPITALCSKADVLNEQYPQAGGLKSPKSGSMVYTALGACLREVDPGSETVA